MPSARTIGTASGVAAASGGVSEWHRTRTWGVTEREASAVMPGDELIGRASHRSTHAVAIDASTADVWPWLLDIERQAERTLLCARPLTAVSQ